MRRVVTSLFGAALFACASSTASKPATTTPPSSPASLAVADPVAPVATDEPRSLDPCATDPGICFDVEPSDAALTINGEPRGAVSDYAGGFLALEPGIYQITLVARGRRTWRAEVAVKARAESLEVTLEPRADP